MKNILVTGSEGYIGAVLVPRLLEKGYKVRGVDTCFYGRFNKGKNFGLIKEDLRDITKIDLKNIDAVIHLAALSNDPIGELDPNLTDEINYKATVNLAKEAKKQGVKRFLFSSSCSIYGIAKKGIIDEASPTNPLTAYARSKIEIEKELIKMADQDFCVGILRNSTVYGYSPSFRNDLVVNNFVTCGLATGEIRVMSDGTPWRPLIDVRDLADIFIEFVTTEPNKFNGEIINIGFAQNNLQVKEILQEIEKQLPQCKVIYTGEHGKDTRSYKVSFNKFHNIFPHVKQNWPIRKSIKDIILELKKRRFGKKEFYLGNYTRLSVLKDLVQTKKIDANLNWLPV